jgi:mannose-1-phosphate guanylyltransferase
LEKNVMELKVVDSSKLGTRCGILLSAGNGTRLREFVHQRRGDDLPKQYVNFVGSRSMLEHTYDRAQRSIPARKLFTVVAKGHLKFQEVRRQLASIPPETVVVQPTNKETAPGVLLPLLHIYKRYPEAVVAVFPSDHFVLEKDRFMRHVDDAFRLVDRDASRLVLLGLDPHGPDTEYGYIVPGEKINASESESARRVELFVEKPSLETTKKIIASGALWNTLVMVFACKTLVSVIHRAIPELDRAFQPVLSAIGTSDEDRVIQEVYQGLQPVNLSKDVLEVLPFEHRRGLVVLPVKGVTWSDWGTSERLSRTLRQLGTLNTRPERARSDRDALRASVAKTAYDSIALDDVQ